MNILKNNLLALEEIDKELVKKLKNIKVKNYEIYQGDDPANINYINTKFYKPLYNNVIKEINDKIKEFEQYRNYPILYFFGLGNGIFYKMLLTMDKLEKIVIYEPDLEIIYMTLSLINLSEEIKNNKIQIVFTPTYQFPQANKLLGDWNFKFFLKVYNLHILTPFYSELYQNEILRINHLNVEAIKHLVLSHGNDATDSLIGIKHGYSNISKMVQGYKYQDLLKQKNSEVAIIVSTGPSLNKQLPLLKEVAPYVTIISVDASLPILEKAGIKPDIVCVLERVELTSQFFVNTSDEFMKDINFVIASLAHQKTIDEIKGKKILTMRPFPYNRYLELDEFGYAGVGMSAANMALEVAVGMKYKKIIFIGQDLAYGDGVSHADGHVLGKDEVVKRKTNDFYVTAYGGKGKVKTYKFWNIFRQTFENGINQLGNKVTIINSTEGGARIHGTLEVPFKDAVKSYNLPKQKILLEKVKKEDSIKYLAQGISKIKEAIEFGEEKKKTIEDLFLEVAKAWDDLVFLNKTNQLDKIDFEHLTDLSDRLDETKELFNDEIFQKIFFDILQPFIINVELELAKIIVKPINTMEEKQARIVDWIMKHKEWLFDVAGSIDTQLYVMKETLEKLEKDYTNIIK